jgi:hypothetical protein
MTTTGIDQRVFEIHGVRVRFTSTVAHHLDRLAEDYGLYFVDPNDDGLSTLHYDVVSTEGSASAEVDRPGDSVIDGPLGDRIVVSASGDVRLHGPAVGDPRAYIQEVRAYLTAAVLTRLVRQRTANQFHASAVHGSRGGVLFAGAKKMGKTSMALLSCLGGAAYMSNDITLLDLAEPGTEGPAVQVMGMPQALSVGLGAVKWFAGRHPSIDLDTSMIADDLDGEALYNLELGEKPKLERAALAELASVRSAPAPLSAIVFPEPNLTLTRPRIRRLSADEALTRLAMLAEAFLKWEWPLALSGEDYLARSAQVTRAAVKQADCWHLQWCPDHDLNLALLRQHAL